MTQIKRNIQDRMSTIDVDTATPVTIINQRPLQARIKEFFTTNQLSQFMDQENVLSEIEHLRTSFSSWSWRTYSRTSRS
jgi:DNA-directed RNA polymerase subunit beta